MNKKILNSILIIALTVLLLIIFQNTLDPFKLRIFNLCGIYVIFAVSMNLINGFTGRLALGHAGFITVGAYTYSLLVMDPDLKAMNFFLKPLMSPLDTIHWPFLPAILLAGIFSALAGFVIGAPALRLRGDYLAIVTLGLVKLYTLTFNILLIIVVGGMGGISGSVIAAVGVTFLMEWLRFLDQGFMGLPELPGLRMVVFSSLLLIVVLFYPS